VPKEVTARKSPILLKATDTRVPEPRPGQDPPRSPAGGAIVFGETKWLDSTARSLNSRVGSTSRVVWGEPPRDEAEHFFQCPACGRWVDGCDLARPALTPSFGLEEFSRNRSNLVHVNRSRARPFGSSEFSSSPGPGGFGNTLEIPWNTLKPPVSPFWPSAFGIFQKG
jgi:hypothetical protein